MELFEVFEITVFIVVDSILSIKELGFLAVKRTFQ